MHNALFIICLKRYVAHGHIYYHWKCEETHQAPRWNVGVMMNGRERGPFANVALIFCEVESTCIRTRMLHTHDIFLPQDLTQWEATFSGSPIRFLWRSSNIPPGLTPTSLLALTCSLILFDCSPLKCYATHITPCRNANHSRLFTSHLTPRRHIENDWNINDMIFKLLPNGHVIQKASGEIETANPISIKPEKPFKPFVFFEVMCNLVAIINHVYGDVNTPTLIVSVQIISQMILINRLFRYTDQIHTVQFQFKEPGFGVAHDWKTSHDSLDVQRFNALDLWRKSSFRGSYALLFPNNASRVQDILFGRNSSHDGASGHIHAKLDIDWGNTNVYSEIIIFKWSHKGTACSVLKEHAVNGGERARRGFLVVSSLVRS